MIRLAMGSLLILLSMSATAQVSITALNTPFNENFDTLANSGTTNPSTGLPAGWLMLEAGTNADTNYRASNGGNTTGDTHSLGSTGNSDRALGGIQTGSVNPTVGAFFRNDTGVTINYIAISFFGEQWRYGDVDRFSGDRLDFQYSTNATSLGTGTWTDVSALDFSAPIFSGAAGALNGNLPANRRRQTALISGLNVPAGGDFYLRWTDLNAFGSDDALGVDDFTLLAFNQAPAVITMSDLRFIEGESGNSNALVRVRLQVAVGANVNFLASTTNGTATEPSDFAAQTNQPYSIVAGQTSVDVPVVVAGDASIEPDETLSVAIANVTTTGPLFVANNSSTITLVNDDPLQKIHDIQGNSNASPLNNSVVSFEGIVTGVASRGFFIQEEDADVDADPATSEGIFVFANTAIPADINRGSKVRVFGTVTEFNRSPFGEKLSTSEIINVTTTAVAANQPLPSVTPLSPIPASSNAIDQYERFEGMYVSLTGNHVLVGPTDGSVDDVTAAARTFGTVYVTPQSTPRPFREIGSDQMDLLVDPTCTRPCFDSNEEVIGVDTDDLLLPALELDAGQVIANIAGPLHYDFGGYFVTQDPFVPLTVTGSTAPTAVATPNANHDLTVAAFNLQRIYDDVDNASVPVDEEPVATAAGFDRRIGKISAAVRDFLKMPDIIAVVEVEDLPTLQRIANRINSDAGANNPLYGACLLDGPTPGVGNGFAGFGRLDVGFLIKQQPVVSGGLPRVQSLVGNCLQVLTTATYTDPRDNSTDLIFDRPPLQIRVTVNDRGGGALPVTLIANHFQSLLEVNSTEPANLSTRGDWRRTKRKAQAEAIAAHVLSLQAANPAERIIVLGDFNAFALHDGYGDVMGGVAGNPAPAAEQLKPIVDVLSNGDLQNLDGFAPISQQYSYVESGTAQSLDHILINGPMSEAIYAIDLEHARINADFANSHRNVANDARKSSDHDPVLAQLDVKIFNDVPTAVGNLPTVADFETRTVSIPTASAFNDGDGDALLYQAANLPNGLSINSATGEISGTLAVGTANNSPYSITVTAFDPYDASAVQSFNFNVNVLGDNVFANGFE